MSVGERTAQARKLAKPKLTQAQLAQKANVSVSLLRKVEQGERPASPAFAAAVARALGVDVSALYGQPFRPGTASEAAAQATVPELRRAILAFDDEPLTERTFEELAVELEHIENRMRDARYGDATTALPDVIRGFHRLAEDTPEGQQREGVYAALTSAYSRAMRAAYHYGHQDLSALAVERCGWAAERSADPLWIAVSRYHRAMIMLYAGAYDAGLRVVDHAHTDLQRLPETPNLLALTGALHLRGSVLAARAANGQLADAHLDAAQELVNWLKGSQYDDYGTQFNPSNVGIHSVAAPVELCDGTTAVARAEKVVLAASTVPSRAGHHHVDVARGWVLHGDQQHAMESLIEARRIAPELTRNHPQVHETVKALARARRGTDRLAAFAKWADVKL